MIYIILFILLIYTYKSFLNNSVNLIYWLAFVVSIVGVNIHYGITFYLSRIVILLFLLTFLLKSSFNKKIDKIWIYIPFISIFIQFISVIFSPRKIDGFQNVFIYISCFFIFILVIAYANKIEHIVKAIKIYLFVGIIQGLYGIYQLFGSIRGWPTYQTILAGIPMANDRTEDGYFYSGPFAAFRAIGFFSSDVSHYSGYLAGVLILSIALISYDKTKFYPYLVFFIGLIGLIFSLSRSGILAFIVFGIPTLYYTLRRFGLINRFNIFKYKFSFFLIFILILFINNSPFKEEIPNPFITLSDRFEDIVNPNEDNGGSMNEHIYTRELGIDAFLSSPIIGVGLGVNASPWYSEKYQAGWGGSHSYHIDKLGQTGLVGIIIEWILMFMILKYMIKALKVKNDNRISKFLLSGLFATYLTIILGNFLYYYYLNDFVWFIMGCCVALSRIIIKANAERLNILSV